MKTLLDMLKTSQLNEDCGGGARYGYGGCGGYGSTREPENYFRSSSKKTNSTARKNSKNEFEKANPDVVKKYKNLYKEFTATKKRLKEISKDAEKMLKEYPELYDFMDSTKWIVI